MVNRERAREMTVNLYGRVRTVLTYDQVVMQKTPRRRHSVKGRDRFAFSDVRRLVAQAALNEDFALLCPIPRNSVTNTLVTALMRLAA
jgi:hypothetical protein